MSRFLGNTNKTAHIERDAFATRLRIERSDGVIELRQYDRIVNFYSPEDERLGLFIPEGLYELRGERLRTLLKDFQDQGIRAIAPFDDARHTAPDEGKAIIREIEFFAAQLPKAVQDVIDAMDAPAP